MILGGKAPKYRSRTQFMKTYYRKYTDKNRYKDLNVKAVDGEEWKTVQVD